MSRLTILGGCGAVGSTAASTLVSSGYFDEIVIADKEMEMARDLVIRLGKKASAVEVSADDSRSLKDAMSGSSVVLNCIGPFL